MPLYQNPSVTSQGKNEEFYLQVARGHIPNHAHMHKTGYIGVGFSNGDTIWENGSPYPWNSLSTPKIINISGNTDALSDRNLPILLIGLDANYKELVEEVRLNASDSSIPVNTTNQFLRINNMYVNNGTTNTKKVLAKVDSTIVYNIDEGFGTGHVGIYTVPAGKTGYLIKGVASCTAASTIGFYVRLLNEGFKLKHIAVTDNSTYVYDFKIPLPFPEKSDMDVRGIIANGKVSLNWDLVLIDN